MASSSDNTKTKSPIEKYPYPTEFNVLDFVPKLLGQANYEKWKKLMRDFIERRGLIDFIDGTAQEENANEDCDEARKRSDNLVQGWILATLSEDIRLEVCDLRTARDLWKQLSRKSYLPFWHAKSPIEKYPYPTEFNVLDFVPKLLGEANYEKWKDLMRDFIDRRGLIGFIDGTAKEEIGNQDYYMAWKRSDNLVQGWILATITEDICLELRHLRTAKDLWEELKKRFDPTSPFRQLDEETENRLSHYLPLLKATIKGDWNEASGIIDQDPDAVRTRITQLDEAALTVAIFSRGRNPFVRKLLEKMTPEDVVNLVNDRGSTALHFAAGTGNIEGAKMLVNKNSELPNVPNELGLIPLNYAAAWGFRKMVLYLQKVTREDMILARGHRILIHLTVGELYGEHLLLFFW
ncbi:hypothetical protein Vadar_009306 [Vaccinium darrowii]|uniref:Uncharacterized protein n=1 Tax=Vaccinium darrowii TaxID=229202 RepID=A0ACB7YKC2_9ERIC|nr:hypothetical protein Vadar_009306 [Vaccinium darrowii]